MGVKTVIFVRSKAADFAIILWTIPFVLLIPLLSAVRSSSTIRVFSRAWCKGVLLILRFVVGIRIRVKGNPRPIPGPVIYAANHQSYLESIFLTVLLKDISFILRDNLYKMPIVGWYLRNYPMIGFARDNFKFGSREFLKESKATIDDGRSILIYPEGTRVPIDEDRSFKKGVSLLQKHLQVPVVPIAHNAGGFWMSNTSIRFPGTVTIEFLDPIEPSVSEQPLDQTLEEVIRKRKKELFDELEIDPLWFVAIGR